jgi:hypothetical protein
LTAKLKLIEKEWIDDLSVDEGGLAMGISHHVQESDKEPQQIVSQLDNDVEAAECFAQPFIDDVYAAYDLH